MGNEFGAPPNSRTVPSFPRSHSTLEAPSEASYSSLPTASAYRNRPLPPPPPTTPKPALPHSVSSSSGFLPSSSRPASGTTTMSLSSHKSSVPSSSTSATPLRFHKTLVGKNVALYENNTLAIRQGNASFDNGIVCTDRPLVAGEHVALRFMSTASNMGFEACPAVGLISRNPDLIRPEDLPRSSENWSIPGAVCLTCTIEVSGGEIVELHYTGDGVLTGKTRGVDRGPLITTRSPRESFWLFVDLRGLFREAQLLPSGTTCDSAVSPLPPPLNDQALAEQMAATSLSYQPSSSSSSYKRPASTGANAGADDLWASMRETEWSETDSSPYMEAKYDSRDGPVGRASELSNSTLLEANFLYDEFMVERKKMEQAFHSAPKQRELRSSAFEFKGVMIVVGKGSIEDEQTDAIVNSTSNKFDMGGAISKAIGARAGRDWIERCKKIGCLNDVHLTDAPNLDCKKVVHIKAPNDVDECRRLIIKALLEAASNGLKSISFPMIGTGGQKLEPYDVAQVLAEVVMLAAANGKLQGISKVRFVAYDDVQYEMFLWTVKDAIQMASSQPLVDQSLNEPPPTPRASDLPANWVPLRDHELCLQIELKPDDPEFAKIKTLFDAEKTKQVDTNTSRFLKDLTLVRVFRLQNPSLYKQYVVLKERLTRKYHDKPDVLKGVERTLFHGTAEGTVSKINTEGFDRSFCGKNMTRFGKGVYFARDLSYSCHPTYSPPNTDKVKSVYVVKALIGVPTLGKEDMPTLPEQSPGVPFDSAVDNLTDPTVFVLFRDFLSYPEYLMHIK